MRFLYRVSLFCLATLLSAGLLLGQSFLGSITGAVTDTSGAVIPGAAVTLHSVTTGQQLSSVTNSAGIYLFSNLNPGVYTVLVSPPASAAGLSPVRSGEITLIAAENTRFDAILKVGKTTQTVNVSTAPPALNTENGLISNSLPTKALLSVPLGNQYSVTGMVMLQSSTYADTYLDSVGGGRNTNINWSIDGVTAVSPAFGNNMGSMITPPYDTIETLKTDTTNSSAEYQDPHSITLSEKSGTNAFHGSAYDYETNWALDATPYFGTSKPKGPIQHNFGGTIGGPVILPHYNGRDKTFFFFSYNGVRAPGHNVATAQVPTAAMMSGDFSQLLPKVVIKDPATGQPFPGNIIPSNMISPVSQNFQKFGFVAPNHMSTFNSGYDWVGIEPAFGLDNQYTARADRVISDKDRLFVRWTYGDFPKYYQYNTDLPYSYYNEDRTDNNSMLGETHTFSTNLLNEFRLGFSRDAANYGDATHTNGVALTQSFGLQEPYLAQKTGLVGFPEVEFTNFSSMNTRGSNEWRAQTTQVLDNVTWMKGRHQFKFGVDFRKNYVNENTCCRYDFGQTSFDGFASGYDYADFLLGIPHQSTLFTRSPQPIRPLSDQIGLYAQDDIQINPRLTINVGIRWDYQPPMTEENGQSYRVDLTNGDLILANNKSQKLLSTAFVSSLPYIHYETAPADGYPANTLLNRQLNDWGPRFSFAYRPFHNDRSVIRGGYGIYYSPLTYTLIGKMGTGPFESDQSFLNTITNGVPSFSFPAPFPATGGIGVQSVGTIVPSLPFPRSAEWNLTVEHELPGAVVVQVDYRGIQTQQLPYEGDWNKPHPGTNPANVKYFTYPEYYTVAGVRPGADQNLNALDAQVTHHSGGLVFSSSYTFARNLSDDTSDLEGADNMIEDPYDLKREWGKLGFMPTQRSVTYFVYDLPFGNGRRFAAGLSPVLNEIVGGWETSGVLNFQTGLWLTPSFSSFDPSNTRTIGGRPDRIGQWRISNPTNQRWFNPAAFAIPGCPSSTPVCSNPADVGRFGTASNGTIEGPGVSNFDFGLFKDFKVHERLNLRFGAEALNALNHPNFGNPNTNISSRSVGTITSTSAAGQSGLGGEGQRTIELQGRVQF